MMNDNPLHASTIAGDTDPTRPARAEPNEDTNMHPREAPHAHPEELCRAVLAKMRARGQHDLNQGSVDALMAEERWRWSGWSNPPEPARGIGWAVAQLNQGSRVTRPGWNGKGMYLYLHSFTINYYDKQTEPMVMMHTADDKEIAWLCSQTDLRANDWMLAPNED